MAHSVPSTTNHDIRLEKWAVLGTLELVKSVAPQEERLKAMWRRGRFQAFSQQSK